LSAQCPTLEALAAYVDHGLPPESRRQIEAHLVVCKPCRNKVALVIKSQTILPDPANYS
jgi:hypothetical protein